MKFWAALLSGGVFGAGLAVSGMTDRSKVLGFLDIAGAWDPTLGWVMAAALLITTPAFLLRQSFRRPLCDSQFHLPTRQAIDAPLLAGAGLFGAGWGLYGYCPGPALTALVYGQWETYLFVAAMLSGMSLQALAVKVRGL